MNPQVRPTAADVDLSALQRNFASVRGAIGDGVAILAAVKGDAYGHGAVACARALQEAGCANADLLDSCRSGDPDIDGVWVLQVLLGDEKR